MNKIAFAAGVVLLPAICTTIGAASVFLLRRPDEPRLKRSLCGMAAGIMLAASIWSLLVPAIERSAGSTLPTWVSPTLGLIIGAAGLLKLEQSAKKMFASRKRHGCNMILAVTLHNLPEGMVVGLAAALAIAGEHEAIKGAAALSIGIGIQNIPEGAAVSLPLAQQGGRRASAFWIGTASGLIEPSGAVIAMLLAEWVSAALPWLMSAAAGCMVCVTAQEMIPEATHNDEVAGAISIVLGFALMMALDVGL